MATKKTGKTAAKAPKAKAPPKKTPKAKVEVKAMARHPKARVAEAHGGKEALAKTLAESLARADQDTGALADQLKKASNQQLLRLAKITAAVKQKWGDREKLIAAIGTHHHQAKDKDFLAKLDTYSLPQLVDLAASAARRART